MAREIHNTLYLNAHPGVKKAYESKEFEGLPIEFLEGDIEPGDTYLAERRNGVHLLTCKSNDFKNGWVVPVENAYSFDTGECLRIKILLDSE